MLVGLWHFNDSDGTVLAIAAAAGATVAGGIAGVLTAPTVRPAAPLEWEHPLQAMVVLASVLGLVPTIAGLVADINHDAAPIGAQMISATLGFVLVALGGSFLGRKRG